MSTFEISPPDLLRAIRWLQERVVYWAMGIAMLAAIGSAWTHGSNHSSQAAMNQRISDFIDQQHREMKELTERVDVLDIRVTNATAKLEAKED